MCEVLGVKLDAVDMAGALQQVACFIKQGLPQQIVTVNAEIIYLAHQTPPLKKIINQAGLVVPDGSGVVWAARLLGNPVPARVPGIDLAVNIAREASREGWPLFLYGAAPGVAAQAATRLEEQFPGIKISGTAHGYLNAREQQALVNRLRQSPPDVLLVALGAPKQEYWIREHLPALKIPVCIGVGGSFDVLAGRVNRAPRWVQRAHLEWFYRIIRDPRRWKRSLAIPRFVWLVLLAKLRL